MPSCPRWYDRVRKRFRTVVLIVMHFSRSHGSTHYESRWVLGFRYSANVSFSLPSRRIPLSCISRIEERPPRWCLGYILRGLGLQNRFCCYYLVVYISPVDRGLATHLRSLCLCSLLSSQIIYFHSLVDTCYTSGVHPIWHHGSRCLGR